MSKANILPGKVSKLSAGARIFMGPYSPKILVIYITLKINYGTATTIIRVGFILLIYKSSPS